MIIKGSATQDTAHLTAEDFVRLREAMVREQLIRRDIRDRRVLEAMGAVPREFFVPPAASWRAYDDSPLELGSGQTISQPYIVARMAELLALEPEDRVLEVGTGLGYAAAVYSRLASEVFTVERIEELAEGAEIRFGVLGIRNVAVRWADGRNGWPQAAPFEAIAVAACAPEPPIDLLDQLTLGGRLVMPLGEPGGPQILTRFTQGGARKGWSIEQFDPVRFVPLLSSRIEVQQESA